MSSIDPTGGVDVALLEQLEQLAAAIRSGSVDGRYPIAAVREMRFRLDATWNPVNEPLAGDHAWQSLLVENPNAFALGIGWSADMGALSNADQLLPAQTARVYTRPFDLVSIGADPDQVAAQPDGILIVRATLYAYPQPPNGWRLA